MHPALALTLTKNITLSSPTALAFAAKTRNVYFKAMHHSLQKAARYVLNPKNSTPQSISRLKLLQEVDGV